MSTEEPWKDEPNYVTWTTRAGLTAVIARNWLKALAAYVGVPAEIPGLDRRLLQAHGGVSYSQYSIPIDDDLSAVAHNAIANAGWWYGFDAMHVGDLTPGGISMEDDVYRTVEYMREECESLAAQLKEHL